MHLSLSVYSSWPLQDCSETISAIPELETPAGPVYYQTIPVEYIDFEPLHIDVVRHVADVHPGQDVLYNEN